jgi:hypothetical protein
LNRLGAYLPIGTLDGRLHFRQSSLVTSRPSGIDQLLRRRYVFHCLEAAVRLSDEDRRSMEVRIHHLMEPPDEQRYEWAPPTLQALYAVANGGAMFCPGDAGATCWNF